MSDWYDVSGNPGTGAEGRSIDIRAEFILVQTAFGKLPVLTSRANRAVFVNASGTGLESVTAETALTRLGLGNLGTAFATEHNSTTGMHLQVTSESLEEEPTLESGQGAVFMMDHLGQPEWWLKVGSNGAIRLTANGGQEFNISLTETAVEFAEIVAEAMSKAGYFRGRLVTVEYEDDVGTVDWKAGSAFDLGTLSGPVTIDFTNLPDPENDECQVVWARVNNAGGGNSISLSAPLGVTIKTQDGAAAAPSGGEDIMVCFMDGNDVLYVDYRADWLAP
jgi:hypothetical protein